MDYYLKLPDAGTFGALKGELESMAAAIDDIGMLFRDDGSASAGYHVNVRMREGQTMPEALLGYAIGRPEHPKRVFMD